MAHRVGHYHVFERIGRGGMGDTYGAHDEKLHRAVALKFIDAARLPDEGAHRVFVRTARSASALSHPSICRVHEVLEPNGPPIVVMERVNGRTVRDLTASGPLEPRLVCRLGRELAEALAAAHACGIVHRNVSASNVMVTPEGHVKLMDLGLAPLPAAAEPPREPGQPVDVHSRAMQLGTPVYLAPELLRGGTPTEKSDLYAAGVVLYRMATGQMPFPERMTPESLAEILRHAPVPPGLLAAGVPASLERAIMGLLEKSPDARFPSAESLAATLRVAERAGA